MQTCAQTAHARVRAQCQTVIRLEMVTVPHSIYEVTYFAHLHLSSTDFLLKLIGSFELQAIYNLAYMVEYNYALNGIHWNDIDKDGTLQGNLTFAASLYLK